MRRLFVGRLSKRTRTRDVEDVFERYGRLSRCDVKYGQDTAYAFVDYDNDRDAEEAVRSEDGRKLLGATMCVEWSKGHSRRLPVGRPTDECYRCGRRGHFGRDCRMSGYRSYGRGRSPRRSRSRSRGRRTRSRSRSRSPRRTRSRTPRRSGSKSPRLSRSKSAERQRSKSISPARSVSPRRERSASGDRKSVPRDSRSRSRSYRSMSPGNDDRNGRSRSRS